MKTVSIIIAIVLIAVLGWYFFIREGHKASQEAGMQNSSLSNMHNSIRSFVGH